MADSFSPLLNLRLQQTGGNDNTWGDLLNSDALTPIENAIAGKAQYTVTGGTLDLSATPLQAQILRLIGTLSSDQTVILPDLSRRMLVVNGTTGNFQVLLKNTATSTNIPQGTVKDVWVTGLNLVYRADASDVGEIKYFGGTSAPAGHLECDGSAISRANYPDLFAAIGTTWGAGNGATTFNLPDLKTAGRFLRSRSGSIAAGTLQAADIAAHNHAASASTSVSLSIAGDGGWTPSISISDPSHGHDVNTTTGGSPIVAHNQDGGGAGVVVLNLSLGGASPLRAANVGTGISASSTGIGNHAHGGSSASASTSVTVNNSTGTETRPINASALACIRY
jgi:microcystin-dependent protein